MPHVKNADLTFIYLEMQDLRHVLPEQVKAMKANDDGTDYTIGDLIDAVIEKIEAYDNCF